MRLHHSFLCKVNHFLWPSDPSLPANHRCQDPVVWTRLCVFYWMDGFPCYPIGLDVPSLCPLGTWAEYRLRGSSTYLLGRVLRCRVLVFWTRLGSALLLWRCWDRRRDDVISMCTDLSATHLWPRLLFLTLLKTIRRCLYPKSPTGTSDACH